eukprot:scaffold29779_cov19-Tisochrysis_lutea.AAC.2
MRVSNTRGRHAQEKVFQESSLKRSSLIWRALFHPKGLWTLGGAGVYELSLAVGGLRSNLWPGAYVCGKDKQSASMYVGWGIKNAPFVPLPPPDVAQEFDQALVESLELPPKPEPEPEEKEEEEEN